MGTDSKKKTDSLSYMRLARDFVQEHLHDAGDGIRLARLWYYRGVFWLWESGRYLEISESRMELRVLRWLCTKKALSEPSVARNVTGCLKARQMIESDASMPFWLDTEHTGSPDALVPPAMQALRSGEDFIAARNLLVKPTASSTGNECYTQPLTPAWFSRIQLPYPYVPSATSTYWENWADERFRGDEARIHLLQEWFGYIVVPSTAYQVALVLCGPSSTGKTTVCSVARALVGAANCSEIALADFDDRFRLALTEGKLLNIADETSPLTDRAERRLRWFISGAPITIERKHVQPYVTTPSARLMVCLNYWPKLRDPTDALYRRLLLLPMEEVITRRDNKIGERLLAELPGILNWSLRGLDRLVKRGVFTTSELGEARKAEVRLENQAHDAFIEDCVRKVPGEFTSHQLLAAIFKAWCDSNGLKPGTTMHEVSKRIREIHEIGSTAVRRVGGISQRGLAGIKVSQVQDK
jgi:P4 family phage/plasmid primase-like protien